jgi:hypothetical protein
VEVDVAFDSGAPIKGEAVKVAVQTLRDFLAGKRNGS